MLGRLQYKRFQSAESPLRSTSAGASAEQFLSLAHGEAESRSIQPEVQMEFNGGTTLTFSSSSSFENVRGTVNATVGEFYDGSILGMALSPTWNQSRHLELNGRYEVNHLSFHQRGLSTTAHLFRLSTRAALNTRLSASVLAQYSNVAELVTFNARFRFNFREGTDLWVVYNEGLNVDREFGAQPILPRSSGRTIMVKYNRALIW